MKLKQLFADDDAVSPVIGVILMVAITVILAAVIGTFVLGLGQNVQTASPSASISFDQIGDGATDSASVKIAHDGGDPLNPDNINLKAEGATLSKDASDWSASGDISAGDTVTVGGSLSNGNVVKVVWTADGGESSNVLGEYEVQ